MSNEDLNKYFSQTGLPHQYFPETKPGAWVCPKCGRVYAGFVSECNHCNKEIDERENTKKVL